MSSGCSVAATRLFWEQEIASSILAARTMASTMSEYRARRAKMLSYLGNKCVSCETSEGLHIDHKDHTTKSFEISACWALAWETIKAELDKCQLLCGKHHLAKSKAEGSLAKGWTNQKRPVHGTAWMYSKYKCRCDDCKAAKRRSDKKIKPCHPD